MFKKLCILLIFSKLKVTKLLIDKYRMHNLCKRVRDAAFFLIIMLVTFAATL